VKARAFSCRDSILSIQASALNAAAPSHVRLGPHTGLLLLHFPEILVLEHLALKAVAAVYSIPVAARANVIAVAWGSHASLHPAVWGNFLGNDEACRRVCVWINERERERASTTMQHVV